MELKRRVQAAETAIGIHEKELEKYNQKLKDAGLNTTRLTDQLNRIIDKIEKLSTEEKKLLKEAERKLARITRGS